MHKIEVHPEDAWPKPFRDTPSGPIDSTEVGKTGRYWKRDDWIVPDNERTEVWGIGKDDRMEEVSMEILSFVSVEASSYNVSAKIVHPNIDRDKVVQCIGILSVQ